MAFEVRMPSFGLTEGEATIVRWLHAVGDSVQADEPLFETENEKANLEVPAPQAGVLLRILVAEGQAAAAQAPVAWIGACGGTGFWWRARKHGCTVSCRRAGGRCNATRSGRRQLRTDQGIAYRPADRPRRGYRFAHRSRQWAKWADRGSGCLQDREGACNRRPPLCCQSVPLASHPSLKMLSPLPPPQQTASCCC